jgi:hypothetical protein
VVGGWQVEDQQNSLSEGPILPSVTFFFWGCIKEEVYRSQPRTQEKLEQQIRDTSAALPLDFVRKRIGPINQFVEVRAKL